MSLHFISLKGDRHSNEDAHNMITNLSKKDNNMAKVNFYGVYDGHGGKFVSDYLSKNLHPFFTDKNVKYPLTKDYVNNVYDKIQNVLSEKYRKESMACGSTCLAVCHYKDSNNKDNLNILNTGDSRCVICRNNIGIPLTLDHKPNWPAERCRINKLGGSIRKDGSVYRINDLSVSRAFGDLESKKFVDHRPDLFNYKLKKGDKFMIVACDGLWDVMSSQDAVNYVIENCYDVEMNRINHNVNISRKLAQYAIDLQCGDNVTAMVVFFD